MCNFRILWDLGISFTYLENLFSVSEGIFSLQGALQPGVSHSVVKKTEGLSKKALGSKVKRGHNACDFFPTILLG